MKTILLIIALVLSPEFIFIGGSALIVVSSGCQHSPRQVALETLEVTQATVHDALNYYGRVFRSGKLKPEQVARVREAHRLYQAAFDSALTAVQFDFKNVTPASVLQLKTDLITIITSL